MRMQQKMAEDFLTT